MDAKVRIGIVGLGNMGSGHAAYLAAGEVPGAELAAVSDVRQERLDWAREQYGERVKGYHTARRCLAPARWTGC